MKDFDVTFSCGCRVIVYKDGIESADRCEEHADEVRYMFSIQVLNPFGKCLVISDTRSEDVLVTSISNAIPVPSEVTVSCSAVKME